MYNLGTGHGLSVLDMVNAMKKATGKEIGYVVGPRREGDIATWYTIFCLSCVYICMYVGMYRDLVSYFWSCICVCVCVCEATWKEIGYVCGASLSW